MAYGYLKQNTNSCSEHEVTKAIRKFQRLFGLKVTGLFDEETLALMKTPRCGLPDNQRNHISKGKYHSCLCGLPQTI